MSYKRPTSKTTTSNAFKVRLCGRDDAPLSFKQLRDGLYQAVRELMPYDRHYRTKSAILYLTIIDEDGNTIWLNEKNEIKIYPYKCAADEFDGEIQLKP